MTTRKIRAMATKLTERLEDLEQHLNDVDRFIAKLSPARTKGYLTPAQLALVAREKSPRRAPLTQRNSLRDVREITRVAFKLDAEKARITVLTGLQGVAIPMASCILAWTFPDKWGVIDQRSWRALHSGGLVKSRPDGTSLGPGEWKSYCDVLNRLSDRLGYRPQHVDRLLYAYEKHYLSQ